MLLNYPKPHQSRFLLTFRTLGIVFDPSPAAIGRQQVPNYENAITFVGIAIFMLVKPPHTAWD